MKSNSVPDKGESIESLAKRYAENFSYNATQYVNGYRRAGLERGFIDGAREGGERVRRATDEIIRVEQRGREEARAEVERLRATLEGVRGYLESWGSEAIEAHEPERQAYAQICKALGVLK